MKIFLDDYRDAPAGWTRVTTAQGLLEALRSAKGTCTAVSLDDHLGHGKPTATSVFSRIDDERLWPSEQIVLHTDGPEAAVRMRAWFYREGHQTARVLVRPLPQKRHP